MKRFEMWKWFRLPVDCNLSRSEDDSDLIGIYEHDILSSHHVEKVEIAINSYDQHIELIAKQAEQIKMLREAVGFAISKIEILNIDAMGSSRMHNVQPWSVRDEVLYKLDESLSATE